MRQTVEEILKENKLKLNLQDFQDIYNPLKVYEKLRGLDIPKEVCMQIVCSYEKLWYKPFMDTYNKVQKDNKTNKLAGDKINKYGLEYLLKDGKK